MPMNTNYFKIGVFVIIAFVLMVAGVVAFGLSSALKPQLACETLFNQSVQGLATGSAVKFRGFKVGQVTGVQLSLESDDNGKQLISVEFTIDPMTLVDDDSANPSEEARAFLVNEVGSGLRVSLSFQGVTGVGFLDLDYDKTAGVIENAQKRDIPPPSGLNYATLYLPSVPGRVQEIGEILTTIVKSVGDVDFAGVGRDLQTLLQHTDQLVSHLKSRNLGTGMNETLERIQAAADGLKGAADNIGGLVGSFDKNLGGQRLREVAADVQKSVAQVRTVIKRLEQLLAAPQSNLPATMENLRIMSENLRDLSELAKRYPSQILFGGAPQEVNPSAKKK